MGNWTEREDKALKAGYEIGRPISEIAAALGRTPGAVRGRASALGVARNKPEEIDEIGFENEGICRLCGQISLTGGGLRLSGRNAGTQNTRPNQAG